MVEQPQGTVTLVFSDIEGSTKLLEALGTSAYRQALAEHREIVRQAFARYRGYEVDYEGDAFFYAFASAPEAVSAVSEAMQGLEAGPIAIRVGIHTGSPELDPPKYVGMDVHTAARIMSCGHGGQVVVSPTTAALVDLPLTELGEHRLKDIADPVSLHQLGEGSFPPLKTISNTNLPRPASSFVGRDDELLEVLSRFEDGARLVTLTGPGGTGKTRLAIEAASELVPEYKAGVFWVGLATLRDPALVTETIAQTLGAKDGLAEHIGQRELLLLIDNLEQVIDAAPDVSELLTACSNLNLLVTSRELLRIQGEVEYSVPPLGEGAAVELFCSRSQLQPDETIAELCRRLDDMPLAVELAAARTKALTPKQILDRLSQRLDLLKGGRDTDPRQQTLRGTIEWSHELLSAEEQQLFARLAVFAGGCTLEAAEEVAEADLDTLQSLVEKSLLRFTGGRYWMLETVREFALERLDGTSERFETQERHAKHMLERYSRIPREGRDWVPLLEAERDNLRTAMTWALGQKDVESSLALVTAYAALCRLRGPFGEGLQWLDTCLQEMDVASPSAKWKVLHAAASLAELQGDTSRAQERGEAALRLARESGDAELVGQSLRMLGMIFADAGDLERSEKLQRESVAIFSQIGNDLELRESLGMLAFLGIIRHDWPGARCAIEEALALSRTAGDRRGIMVNTANLGHVLARERRYREALGPLRESVLLAHELLDLAGVAAQLEDVAGVAARLDCYEQAAAMMGGAEALYERTGFNTWPALHEWREATVTSLEQELGAKRLSELWSRGRNMTVDELVTQAIAFVDAV